MPADAQVPLLLTRSPGVKAWATVGGGPIQCMHSALGILWVVTGGVLYAVNSVGATAVGAVGNGDEIDIDANLDTVVVVNPPRAYYYDGSTFAEITDSDFTDRGAGDVEFLDGYMLFREPDTARFFCSDLNDATAYNALNFATAEGAPDELVGLKVDHRQILLFGAKSIEVWENTGASGFPFERMINGFVEIGCANGRTIAKIDNSVYWLADDFTVRRLDGLTPVRVSTHAIEQRIRECTLLSARGYTYTLEGHLFYILSFDEGTFVFDITTQLWHERQSYERDNWRWSHPTAFGGRILVADATSNVIGELSPTTYSELGTAQIMEWTYQPIYAEGRTVFHDRLEMFFERGVGLSSGQGSDPEVMLELSDDGGKTWTSLPTRKLGPLGEYRQRAIWHSLGSSPARVYRASVSDPVQVVLTDTQWEGRGGRL